MLSSLDPSTQSFLRGLDQIQRRGEAAQRQMLTGLRLNVVSDDPTQIANLWQTRSDLARTNQIDTNLGRVKTEVDTAETVLESAVSLMDRALTLGTQGASGATTHDTRQSLADELGAVLQQLVSSANTVVDGRNVFAGDTDQVTPYTFDLTQTNPVGAYQGSASTRQLQLADGSLLTASRTAQDIFDSPVAQQNVFATINSLRNALLNDDENGAKSAIADVRTASSFLNSQLAFYGTVQNRVTSGLNYAKTYETQLETQLSGIEDADVTQSITDLQQTQIQQQAALVSHAQFPRKSLFDYMA
jgi:flagellar hook-associated protein 3 FlgL